MRCEDKEREEVRQGKSERNNIGSKCHFLVKPCQKSQRGRYQERTHSEDRIAQFLRPFRFKFPRRFAGNGFPRTSRENDKRYQQDRQRDADDPEANVVVGGRSRREEYEARWVALHWMSSSDSRD